MNECAHKGSGDRQTRGSLTSCIKQGSEQQKSVMQFSVNALGYKDLKQRRVGYVAFVCKYFQREYLTGRIFGTNYPAGGSESHYKQVFV